MFNRPDICETCLSVGRKMCNIDEDQLQSICPGFQLSVTNSCVCWECCSMVYKWIKFRDRVVKAQETLADYNTLNNKYVTLSSLKVTNQENISITSSEDELWMTKEEDPHVVDVVDVPAEIKVEPEIEYETPLESPFKEDPIVCDYSDKPAQRKCKRHLALEPIRVFVKEITTKKHRQTKIYSTRSKTNSCIKTEKIKKHKLKKKQKKVEFSNNIDVNVIDNTDNNSSEETETADEFEDENEVTTKTDERVIFRTVRVERDKLLRLMNRARKKRRFIQSKLLKCPSCIILFKTEQYYNQHMRRHDEAAGPYVCDLCQLRFKTAEYVKTHEDAHFDKIIECVECREQFVASWDFSSHYNDYHAYRDIMCWKCIMMFPTMKEYIAHRKEVHSVKMSFTCDHCGKKLSSKNTLLNHIKKFHSVKRVTTKCPICFRVLKGDWKHVQENHMKLHLQPRPPIMKNENSFCVECNIQYSTEAIFKKHVKEKHEGETRSECPHCGKLFRNLKSHIDSTHSTELKYSCPECNKKFKTNYSKNYHLRFSHRGMPKPRNKTCPKCQKTFGCKRQLEDHMNSHTGERPHVCAVCGATFGHRSALFTHTRLKHKHS